VRGVVGAIALRGWSPLRSARWRRYPVQSSLQGAHVCDCPPVVGDVLPLYPVEMVTEARLELVDPRIHS
jgi:hypothetical protein